MNLCMTVTDRDASGFPEQGVLNLVVGWRVLLLMSLFLALTAQEKPLIGALL